MNSINTNMNQTTKSTQSTADSLICQAITKKTGLPCKYKARCGSKFCGIHKNFIDTSKSLFTEEEEETTYKLYDEDGKIYEITDDSTYFYADEAITKIKDKYNITDSIVIYKETDGEPLDDIDVLSETKKYIINIGFNITVLKEEEDPQNEAEADFQEEADAEAFIDQQDQEDLTKDNATLLESIGTMIKESTNGKDVKTFKWNFKSPDGKEYKLVWNRSSLTCNLEDEFRKQNNIPSRVISISIFKLGEEEPLKKNDYMNHEEQYFVIVGINTKLLEDLEIIKENLQAPLTEFLYDNYRAWIREYNITDVVGNHKKYFKQSYKDFMNLEGDGSTYPKIYTLISHCTAPYKNRTHSDEIISGLLRARDVAHGLVFNPDIPLTHVEAVYEVNRLVVETVKFYQLDEYHPKHLEPYFEKEDPQFWA